MKQKEQQSRVSIIQHGIIELIKQANLSVDDRLPGETELTQRFGVSRSSVREALANLSQEGIIYKIQGKGTFLRTRPDSVNNGIDTLFSVTEAITKHHAHPTTKRINISTILPSSAVAHKLNISEDEACYLIHRVRYADEAVAVYNINTFPVRILGEGLKDAQLQGSLFQFLASRGHVVSHAQSNITPAILTRRDIPELATEVGLFLMFEEVYFNTKGEIIGYTNDYYNNEMFDFSIIRNRIIE
ncbi:MAG: GntR family transcriptional regulator [Vibrio sp.]